MASVDVPARGTHSDVVRIVDLTPTSAAVVRVSGPVAELPRLYGDAFARTARAIEDGHGRIAGPPFARYLEFGHRVVAEVGFPFAGGLAEDDRVYRSELPGGPTVTTTHVGPYDAIGIAWEAARSWIEAHGLTITEPAWETYLTGPQDPGPPVTSVYWPIRRRPIDDH